MENKPHNVFEKLDKQEEKIENISSKLEDISINDLYALAKRTWNYGDFQTAQKYYNHISLLKPLDWEAPLYASLCNFKGYHDMFFWTKAPNQVEKIIVSTFEYINSLDLDNTKKDYEMKKCCEIVKNEMLKTKEHYFKYKELYDKEDSKYIYTLQNYYLSIIYKAKTIESSAINGFVSLLAEELLDLIENMRKVSPAISKNIFNELNNKSSKKFNFNFDEIYESSKEECNVSTNKLTSEGIKFKEELINGVMLVALSIIGIIFSLLSKKLYSLFFVLPSLYGIYLIIATITSKGNVNCSSILYSKREKYILTSDGNVIIKQKKNILSILFSVGSALLVGAIILFAFTIFKQSKIELLHKLVILICGGLSTLIYYLSILKFSN